MKRRGNRKALTARELQTAYQQCLERERDRERKWQETYQGAFEDGFLPLDFEMEEARERDGFSSWFTDHGRGAAIIRAVDPPAATDTRQKRIDWAKHRIMRYEPDCLVVFWLILRNGKNRRESISELMRKTRRNYDAARVVYWDRLKKLKILFGAP